MGTLKSLRHNNNIKIKKFISKVLLVTLLSSTCATFTGCGTSLTQYVQTNYPVEIRARAQANIDIAADLYQNGYITEKLKNKIEDQINKQTNKILAGVENTEADKVNTDAISTFTDAVYKYNLRSQDFVG